MAHESVAAAAQAAAARAQRHEPVEAALRKRPVSA
jgi:hypothetical protein